jgi:hypothetical protein
MTPQESDPIRAYDTPTREIPADELRALRTSCVPPDVLDEIDIDVDFEPVTRVAPSPIPWPMLTPTPAPVATPWARAKMLLLVVLGVGVTLLATGLSNPFVGGLLRQHVALLR